MSLHEIGEIAEALRLAGHWNEADKRYIVLRLATEVHRLRLKTRLQRRTIAELGAHAPATLAVTEIEGSKVLPEAPHDELEAARASHAQGEEKGKLDMLDALKEYIEGNLLSDRGAFCLGVDALLQWMADHRKPLGQDGGSHG